MTMSPPLSKFRQAGDTFYLSGELGFTPEGGLAEGVALQTRVIIERITETLAGLDLGLADVVTATCYLAHAKDFAAFNEVYAEMFPSPYPARTTVESRLMLEDAKVEITVVAVKG